MRALGTGQGCVLIFFILINPKKKLDPKLLYYSTVIGVLFIFAITTFSFSFFVPIFFSKVGRNTTTNKMKSHQKFLKSKVQNRRNKKNFTHQCFFFDESSKRENIKKKNYEENYVE
jgi:uncharacterized membrane protein